jgi:hypothetical protein
MNHPVLSAIAAIDAALDQVAEVDPMYLTVEEKKTTLVSSARVRARTEALELRLLAAAEHDVADATGTRSTATWVADETRQAHGTLRRHAALAAALDSRWTQTADAFAAGDLNHAQTQVIADALAALPQDLGDDLIVKAETLLVDKAAAFGPRELRIYGRGILDHLAPDIADDIDYQRLLAEEARASAATKLVLRPRGDGSVDLHARIPDHVAGRLRAYLNAFTAPRRHHHWDNDHWDNHQTMHTPFGPMAPAEPDEFATLPAARQRGEAFVALLENIPTTHLPRHGGTATSVMVTLDYDTLVADLTTAGIAHTSTGNPITAGQARRLACQAGIIPLVLGGNSEILDVGQLKRLVTDVIRKALNLRDRGCTEVGCSIPAEFCEAHHIVPWSKGGKTSLKDCKLLCPFHHHRAHDPAWTTHHHPHGTTSFTRRQ